jgi:hypothetical protein
MRDFLVRAIAALILAVVAGVESAVTGIVIIDNSSPNNVKTTYNSGTGDGSSGVMPAIQDEADAQREHT